MYSYGPPHMAEQKQDDQLEHTYSSYVRIRDVALKTCRKRWTIGRSGKRGSRISVLAARHDDDDAIKNFPWSVSWWPSTGVWIAASLRKSPGLFSVFWPILIILLFGWSPLVILFPTPSVPLPILWRLYRAHRLQMVLPSLSCYNYYY